MALISIRGQARVKAALRRAQAEIRAAASPAARAGAETIKDRALELVPRDKGLLAAGIGVESRGPVARVVSRRAGTPGVPVFVERGTSKMKAEPYLEPAINEGKVVGAMIPVFRAAIR